MSYIFESCHFNLTNLQDCLEYADYLEKILLPEVVDLAEKYSAYQEFFSAEAEEYLECAEGIRKEIETLRMFAPTPDMEQIIKEYESLMDSNALRKKDWHTNKKRPSDRRHGKHRPLTRKQEKGVHGFRSGVYYTTRGKRFVPIYETDRGYHAHRYDAYDDTYME